MMSERASREFGANPGLNQPERDRGRKWSSLIVRLLISLTLLVGLLALADIHAIFELLRKANVSLFVLVLLWMLFDRSLHAWKWILLLRVKMKDISVRLLLRVQFISNFVGNFIPFNIGNDITRVVGVAKHSGNTLHPLSSVIVERILGLVSLVIAVVLAVTVGMIRRASVISPHIAWTILGSVAVFACSGFVLWKARLIKKIIIPLVGYRTAYRWINKMAEVYDACLSYGMHKDVILRVILISSMTWVNAILTTYVTALALGIDVPLIYFFLCIPIISFLSLLPISANGIGIMEGAFVFFFSQVGASTSQALTLGLAMRVLMMVATLPGALLLAIEGWPAKKLSTTKASTV